MDGPSASHRSRSPENRGDPSVDAKEAAAAAASAADDLNADAWVDGLYRYRWRNLLTIFSDPRGKLVRGTGAGMWCAGEILSDYFIAHPELCRDGTCLELGSGLGTVGLTIAACGARCVILTDMERQMPLLHKNVEFNFPQPAGTGQEVHARILDWRVQEQRDGLAQWKAKWNLIVASDVGYDPDLFEDLVQTLLAQCSPTTSIYFALADRQEPEEPDVEDFACVARKYFDVQFVHEGQLEPSQSVTKVILLTLRGPTAAGT